MVYKRIHRLLQLITTLEAGTARSADQLADDLDVSRRTLFRDLKTLQESGVPCFHDVKGGYRIASSFFLPATNLSVSETLALVVLARVARPARSGPARNAALSAINKLISAVPDPMRCICLEMIENLSIDPGPQTVADTQVSYYHLLQTCVHEHRACHVVYRSPSEPGPIDCELQPYALHFSKLAWYVLGRTDIYDEVRIFRLERFQSIEPTDRIFERPKDFKVSDKIGQAWQLIPEGKVYPIELLFSKMVATNVSEIRWHQSQQHEILPDGRCRMTFQIDGLGEIAWWLCGYADQVEIIKPAALRKKVQQMHAAAAHRLA